MNAYKSEQQKCSFYDSYAWRKLSKQIKKRDNNECQECKRKGEVFIDDKRYSERAKRKKIQLVVHHIKELEHYPELALDEENLETVCVNCHNREHNRYFHHGNQNKNKWIEDERW